MGKLLELSAKAAAKIEMACAGAPKERAHKRLLVARLIASTS
jgi:hypothetical protein